MFIDTDKYLVSEKNLLSSIDYLNRNFFSYEIMPNSQIYNFQNGLYQKCVDRNKLIELFTNYKIIDILISYEMNCFYI